MLGFEYNREDAEKACTQYGIELGREEGRAEGLAEGFAKGRAEGRAESMLAFVKNLMSMNMSIEQIVQATGLTEADILKIAH